jgi:hypothetical protein
VARHGGDSTASVPWSTAAGAGCAGADVSAVAAGGGDAFCLAASRNAWVSCDIAWPNALGFLRIGAGRGVLAAVVSVAVGAGVAATGFAASWARAGAASRHAHSVLAHSTLAPTAANLVLACGDFPYRCMRVAMASSLALLPSASAG